MKKKIALIILLTIYGLTGCASMERGWKVR